MSKEVKKFLSKITPDKPGGQARKITFVLGNGLKVEAGLEGLSPEIVEQLAMHGLSQKIGDAAAGFSKARDFSGAFSAMQSVADNLVARVWASRGTGGTSDLVAALCELQGLELEQVQEAVDKMTEEQLAEVSRHPAVKEAIARIKAERLAQQAKGAEDLGDLLKAVGL